MAGGIFISYRRDDSRHAAGRLVDRLAQTFRRDQLFMDVDTIEPGLDFLKVIDDRVAACDVMLAVMGPGWVDARDETGQRRLDNPDDFVRREIEAALARDVRVIPVLVDGASVPRASELPDSLQPLVRRNAVRLTHERFGADAGDLASSLAKVVSKPAGSGWFSRTASPAGAIQKLKERMPAASVPPDRSEATPGAGRAPGLLRGVELSLPVLAAALTAWIVAVGFLSFGAGMFWQESSWPHLWGAAAGGTGASLATALLLFLGHIGFWREVTSRETAAKVMYAAALVAGVALIIFWLNIK